MEKRTTGNYSPNKKGRESNCNINTQQGSVVNNIYTVIIIHIKLIISINKYIHYNHRDIIVILLNN